MKTGKIREMMTWGMMNPKGSLLRENRDIGDDDGVMVDCVVDNSGGR
jgi:hypothetical protein